MWTDEEQLILSYCENKFGFGNKALIYLYNELYENKVDDEHLDIVYSVLAERIYIIIRKVNPNIDLSEIIFKEIKMGYIYPERDFYCLLLERLKIRAAQINNLSNASQGHN